MDFLKYKINSTLLNLLLGLYFVFCLNFALIRDLFHILSALEGVSFPFVVSIFFFFSAVFNILFTLLGIKYVEKPLFIFLIVASSLVNFAMYNYKVIFDVDMITNIFETNMAEATTYSNPYSIFWILATGIIPAFLLSKAQIIHHKPLYEVTFKLLSIAISLAIIGIIALFYFKDYASIIRNNSHLRKEVVPYYYVNSTIKYVYRTYFYEKPPYEKVGEDAVMSPNTGKKRLLVVVLGETARSMNYQLNGYARPTNANTAKIPNIISFRHVSSCGTSTAVSVPCMFSMLGQKNYSRSRFENQDNVTDILKRAGISQLWVDNDGGCKGVCRDITTIDVDKTVKPYCEDGACTDNILLESLDGNIKSLEEKDAVLYLHVMGSHGPTYHKRVPSEFKTFKPLCERSDIQNCSDDKVVNSYDDSILFTDYVLAQVIARLQKEQDKADVAMLYVSDHGESLGEDGVYLHGLPYSVAPAEQTRVPLIVWMPEQTASATGYNADCLKKIADSSQLSHDSLPHMLLGFMGIKTKAYDDKLDVFGVCLNGK